MSAGDSVVGGDTQIPGDAIGVTALCNYSVLYPYNDTMDNAPSACSTSENNVLGAGVEGKNAKLYGLLHSGDPFFSI